MSESTNGNAGLRSVFGAMHRNAIAGVGRITRGAASSVSNHELWAIRLVFVAGVATIIHKSGLEFDKLPTYGTFFAVCLGLAALLYEMNAARSALRNFWSGRMVGTVGWLLIWGVAFIYSMNQWIGAASENEGAKTNMHKAAYQATLDVRSSLDDARKRLRAEEANYEEVAKLTMTPLPSVAGKPVANVGAADALIAGMKANTRFWETLTEGCTKTSGKQTRAFCNDYAQAVAARVDLAGRKDWDGKLVQATQQRDEARKAFRDATELAANTKVETSTERNDLTLLTRYGGLKEEDARTLQALGSIIAISIFLSMATALRELETLRATQRRVPMFGWLWRFGQRIWTGKSELEIATESAARGGHVTIEDGRAVGELQGRIAEVFNRTSTRLAANG